MTNDEIRSLRKGDVLLDEKGKPWTVSMAARPSEAKPMAVVRQGNVVQCLHVQTSQGWQKEPPRTNVIPLSGRRRRQSIRVGFDEVDRDG